MTVQFKFCVVCGEDAKYAEPRGTYMVFTCKEHRTKGPEAMSDEKSYVPRDVRPPTEEELYIQRLSRETAQQQASMNQGWQQGGYHGAIHPPNALDPRMNEGPTLDYDSQSAYQREQNAMRKRVYDVEDEQRKLLTKVENLQESLTASCKHVAELNDKLDSLNAWDDEQERKDRWHETQNAALSSGDTLDEARKVADRAHGPLEPSNQTGASEQTIKFVGGSEQLRPGAINQMDIIRGVKLDGPAVDEGPFFKHITFVENPEMYTMYKRSDVDALAKAASDAWVYIGSQPETIGGRLVFKVLDAALKPFKRSE